jgi:prophage maintenance system killer protein
LAAFAFLTRNQFYFNGNKRTAKFMANGLLMSNGFNAINPRSRTSKDYHQALDTLFRDGDATPIMAYLAREAPKYRV